MTLFSFSVLEYNLYMKNIKRFSSTNSVHRFMLLVLSAIVISEGVVMMFLETLSPFSPRTTMLLDIILLSILITPLLYFFVFRPMTTLLSERTMAEGKLKMYEQTIRSMNSVINIADLNDSIIFVNPAFCKLYGYSEDELIGKHSSVFWSERNAKETVDQILPATLDGGWKGELFNKRKDGTEFPIYLSTSVIKNDSSEQIAVIGIVEDITERKQTEREREVMYEITQGVTTTANLDELMKLMHRSLRKVLYAENCFVALYDQTTNFFSFLYFVDQFDPVPAPVAMQKSCTSYVFRCGKPMIITSTVFKQLQELNEVELVGSPSPSWIGVPLHTPSNTIGVLVLQHYEKENIYSERDLRFLNSVGSQVAIMVERKQADAALRDSETNLNVILESTADGILAVDNKGTVIRTNNRFAELWRIPQSLLDSKDDDGLLHHVMDQLVDREEFLSGVRLLYESSDEHKDILHFKDGRLFERYSAPIIMGGDMVGRVWSFRDITERDRKEKEREGLIADLQNAIEQIKTLRGIVPICAHCKKIRDDKGYWEQVDAYVSRHSEAQFSHSICPDCTKEHFPELYNDKNSD